MTGIIHVPPPRELTADGRVDRFAHELGLAAGAASSWRAGWEPLDAPANPAALERVLRALRSLPAGALREEARNGTRAIHKLAALDLEPSSARALCEALSRSGVSWQARNCGGRSALHVACFNGRAPMGIALLECGVDPMGLDACGDMPLHDAAASGCLPLAVALLAAGADPTARNKDGASPADVCRERLAQRVSRDKTSFYKGPGQDMAQEIARALGSLLERADLALAVGSPAPRSPQPAPEAGRPRRL